MNIELAPRSESEMTYGEAILYCRFLECNERRDWRMPTIEEWRRYNFSWSWYIDRKTDYMWYVTPVRDVCLI